MHCRDTNNQLPSVHCEYLDTKTMKKLNKLAGIILSPLFEGNGEVTLIYNGGKVPKLKFGGTVLNDEKQSA